MRLPVDGPKLAFKWYSFAAADSHRRSNCVRLNGMAYYCRVGRNPFGSKGKTKGVTQFEVNYNAIFLEGAAQSDEISFPSISG